MRRVTLFVISLIAISFSPQLPASGNIQTPSSEEIITLADTRNRDLAGVFYDTALEARLLPTGSLGARLERASQLPADRRVLFIDPMLIEEIQDMSDGYLLAPLEGDEPREVEPSPIASQWLERLRSLSNGDEIAAINYGNPDIAFLSRAAPTELRIHHSLSRQRLAELLSRDVSEYTLIPGTTERLPNFLTERFTQNRREIRTINRYAKNPETKSYRLINGSLLDPRFPKERAFEFARELDDAIDRYGNSIRITSGRYTLTSANERVPVTLINDFANDLTVRLTIFTSNSRVLVGSLDEITIAARSKLPITIPVEVLSSGQSDLIITITTLKGEVIGREVRLPLTLAVISPLTTWITTGSGLILLLAAIIQSVRRVRRSRKKAREEGEG